VVRDDSPHLAVDSGVLPSWVRGTIVVSKQVRLVKMVKVQWGSADSPGSDRWFSCGLCGDAASAGIGAPLQLTRRSLSTGSPAGRVRRAAVAAWRRVWLNVQSGLRERGRRWWPKRERSSL